MVADRFRLRYRLAPDDWKAFARQSRLRLKAGYAWQDFLVLLLIWAAVSGAIVLLPMAGLVSETVVANLMTGTGIGMVLMMVIMMVLQRRCAARRFVGQDALIGEFRLVAYEGGGIQITGTDMNTSYDWSAFLDISQTPKHIILWLGAGSGTIVPLSAFADAEQAREFADFVSERIEVHKKADEHVESE